MYYLIAIIVYFISLFIIVPRKESNLSNTSKTIIIFIVLPLVAFMVAGILCVILGIEITKP